MHTEGEDTIETLYIGDYMKRAKKGIFRAYYKGIDLGLADEIVTRIELEIKREKAQTVAKRLHEKMDIAGNFRTYFDVKHADFERIMEASAVEAVRGKGKLKKQEQEEIDSRWKWLMEQVAPALKEAIEKDEKYGLGNGRMFDFMARAGMVREAEKFAAEWALWKFEQHVKGKIYRLD